MAYFGMIHAPTPIQAIAWEISHLDKRIAEGAPAELSNASALTHIRAVMDQVNAEAMRVAMRDPTFAAMVERVAA